MSLSNTEPKTRQVVGYSNKAVAATDNQTLGTKSDLNTAFNHSTRHR